MTLTQIIASEVGKQPAGTIDCAAIAKAVEDAGYVAVPASVVNGVIKSFRDVEERGSLYDAATHRWIDLLAEVSNPT